ncbi:serine--pyruvate aminotransferase [Plakobranchus ocellatus]|uniref:Serine--pyruvate aminotransferase n=1 Tax=Plakobranchus ocellatus TaxID=259542 RepID=A0AAV4AM46_9GAST|nr:serine--pyruvate aminotransferase [Plakobranchus ocellatus]
MGDFKTGVLLSAEETLTVTLTVTIIVRDENLGIEGDDVNDNDDNIVLTAFKMIMMMYNIELKTCIVNGDNEGGNQNKGIVMMVRMVIKVITMSIVIKVMMVNMWFR